MSKTIISVESGSGKTEITAPNGSKTDVTGAGVIVVNIGSGGTDEVIEPPLLRIVNDSDQNGIISNPELASNQNLISLGAKPQGGARVGDAISVTDGHSVQTQAITNVAEELIFKFIPVTFDAPTSFVSQIIRPAYPSNPATTQIVVANNTPKPYKFITGLTIDPVTPNTDTVFNHLLQPIVGAALQSWIGHSFAVALTAGSELRLQLNDPTENFIALTPDAPTPSWDQAYNSRIRLSHQGGGYVLYAPSVYELQLTTDTNGWLRVLFNTENVLEFYDGATGALVASEPVNSNICYLSLFRFYQTADSLPIGLQLNLNPVI